MRIATVAAALLALVTGTLGLAHAQQPSVLFAGTSGGGCGFEVARKLNAAGFALRGMPYPGLDENPLTWEQVQGANVLVLTGLGRANADMTLPARTAQTLETLRRFLEAGGGVLWFSSFGQMATDKPPQDAFLNPLGLTPLFAEMPADPETEVVGTAWKIPFSHAAGMVASPVMEGVTSLWYPTPHYRIGAQNHTIPFSADANWTVLVKGGRGSLTKAGPLQAGAPTDPGTYRSEVPIIASREVGKGRIVYLGITPEYLIGPHALTTLEGVVLERGMRNAPSGGYKLLENALKWLAEPSLGGELGGAAMDAAMLEDPHKTRFGTAWDWSPGVSFPAVEPAHTGAIGARTTYSTGKATVAEWVAAAKARGLAFIVFLE
ncbi:MAG: hypothetical protein FJX74_11610, partial [Armatimonadetes bacterium]|nr:hypothetical protein [Armatimonadota bacterium]